ncbi:hypothetical protein Landi51_06473 [Colletotrichum acutatum]
MVSARRRRGCFDLTFYARFLSHQLTQTRRDVRAVDRSFAPKPGFQPALYAISTRSLEVDHHIAPTSAASPAVRETVQLHAHTPPSPCADLKLPAAASHKCQTITERFGPPVSTRPPACLNGTDLRRTHEALDRGNSSNTTGQLVASCCGQLC